MRISYFPKCMHGIIQDLVWPTPGGITEIIAIDTCKKIELSASYQGCKGAVPNLEFSLELGSCVDDILV